MPATDALQPRLTEGERKVVKAYGGWTPFMQSMGLKPWEDDDAEMGKSIAASFAAADEEEKEEEKRQEESKANASGSKAK